MGFNSIRGTLGILYAWIDSSNWSKYFAYVEDECLMLCDNLKSSKFNILYCLFNTDVDSYVSDILIENQYFKNKKVLLLCHKYEIKSLEIFHPEEKYFIQINNFLLSKSWNIKSPILNKITEQNWYCFGKLFIHI